MHTCTECAEIFMNKKNLNKHFKNTHATSSYLCTTCGKRATSRGNYVKHLRTHDTSYTPGFKCDFCSHRARDNWHLDKHMLSHFKNSDCKSLNSPLCNFSAMTVKVSLTEIRVGDVCSSLYRMTISKGEDGKESGAPNDVLVDDIAALDDIGVCFKQLGLEDSDWSDWLQISSIMDLSPYSGFMSWVGYEKVEDKEVFQVCIQEKVRSETCNAVIFIENGGDDISNDICEEKQPAAAETSAQEGFEICKAIVLETAGFAVRNFQNSKFPCDKCDGNFKDNTHLNEHRVRMHTGPTPCMICNVVYPDKHSASIHQRTCSRRCPYDHCSFQSRHKHTYLKHLRGHEKLLRRFSAS